MDSLLTPEEREWCKERAKEYPISVSSVEYALIKTRHDKAFCIKYIQYALWYGFVADEWFKKLDNVSREKNTFLNE